MTFLDIRIKLFLISTSKDQNGYGLIQWRTTLHCNVVLQLTESITRQARKKHCHVAWPLMVWLSYKFFINILWLASLEHLHIKTARSCYICEGDSFIDKNTTLLQLEDVITSAGNNLPHGVLNFPRYASGVWHTNVWTSIMETLSEGLVHEILELSLFCW